MNVILFVEVESGEECPYSFTKSDGSLLFEYIMENLAASGMVQNVLGKIEKHFHFDLEPLGRIGGQEFELEDFDMNEEEFNQAKAQNIASWQSPQVLIDCIQPILAALDENPDIFSVVDVSENYFARGVFKQDLVDLLRMINWANEKGEKKVRIAGA